ncbi:hypothetical protein [Streptomyces sp. NPDC005498]|uniref:hypothetical protein n=1 Tax=Streptomyces sp. NPDC005498 TaxID=3364717 RepID=UPI0036B2B999
MRSGATYTRHFDLETRQHELLGLDLGEGAPRRTLVLGFVLYLLWTGGLLLILGLPGKFTFTLYFLPPLLTAIFGTQRSRKNERRWNITYWALTVRYVALGHRPIICGGRRSAARVEWIPRRERMASRGGLRPGRDTGRDASTGPAPLAGAPIRLDARPRLYGPDQVYKARGRRGGKTTGKTGTKA